ncbi:alkaline phosphatase D family protein [Labedaea rhizosphaerae]|uniref:Alkaline phosphatase D n=1 Tax=Labedaea rhizosphaerae TaxID=598644 RepID=A0A4R6SC62_LABRH|nr:alkaline phosphatase D family protein [Labedaea rhizosphaerae]TDP97153.1 alkaline phosphatase D [Labedaea rhizosphaerae]
MTSTPLDRRSFLRTAAIAGGALLVPAAIAATASADAAPQFAHGVASGDPLPDGVLLWTRVTPTSDSLPGSGQGPTVDVRWDVATDSGFGSIVRSGVVTTGPERDHTVKVDVAGLSPATTYYYRFTLDGATSSIGRTRTAPAPDAAVAGLRMGLVSCANWQGGYFGSYRHLAARTDLDAILHVGDYLYEYQVGGYGARDKTIRPHVPEHEIVTLTDYRQRHAQYKTDPDVQALHALHPWLITWDDHEYANDTWSDGAQNHQPDTEGPWSARKAAAQQAYSEWMPVRLGPGNTIYRTVRWGRLAEFSLLDLRSYRSKQVTAIEGGMDDPSRTITGDAQMEWLKGGLASSPAQWKLVGNSVMITPIAVTGLAAVVMQALGDLLGIPIGGVASNADAWDGYTADRTELLSHIADNNIQNTVFLTGDIHTSWAANVPVQKGGAAVATEFVTPSVTSDNIDDILNIPPRTGSLAVEAILRGYNPHVKLVELDSHGYSVVDVNAQRVQADWYYLNDRTSPTTGVKYSTSMAVASGTHSIQKAGTRL